MPQSERNTGKEWTTEEENELERLIEENTPTRIIGLKLGRPEEAIYSKAQDMGGRGPMQGGCRGIVSLNKLLLRVASENFNAEQGSQTRFKDCAGGRLLPLW